MKDENAVFDRLVERCAVELFAAYDVSLTQLVCTEPSDAEDFPYMGLIGFTGESIRGTLLLAPSTISVAESRWQTREQLRDWVGELANQLLGRIKNQLLRYGVEINLTTPIVIRGSHLAPVDSGGLKPYSFDAWPGKILMWVDAEMIEGLRLELKPAVEHHNEGDAIIF